MAEIINMGDWDPQKARAESERRRQEMQERAQAEQEKRGGSGGGGDVPSSFVMQCLGANELGDGMLYAAMLRERFVYNHNLGEWYEWQGNYWRRDTTQQAYQAVELVAVRYLQEKDKIDEQIGEAAAAGNKDQQQQLETVKKNLLRRVDRLRSQRGRINTLSMACSCDDGLGVNGNNFDANPYLLACENGVLDLRTGQLRDGRHNDWLSKRCPVQWQGIDSPAEAWDQALLEIMDGSQDMVDFLRRALGYCALGINPENVFFVLAGQGRNGKSLLVETISWVMGDLSGPIPAELLLDQGKTRSSSGPTPDIMTLKGLRLALATETDEGCKISPSRVKWLTGEDTLTGRNPHDKYATTFTPSHSLLLLTNHKPHAPADDFAFWERLLLIPFELSFVNRRPQGKNERPQDRTLKTKFRNEASGILAWIVRGCLEYQAQGLCPPPKVKEAVAEYRRDEDLLADFIDERCIVGENLEADASDLYKAFESWYMESVGKRVPAQRTFGRWISKKFERFKRGTVKYKGIGLVAD